MKLLGQEKKKKNTYIQTNKQTNCVYDGWLNFSRDFSLNTKIKNFTEFNFNTYTTIIVVQANIDFTILTGT